MIAAQAPMAGYGQHDGMPIVAALSQMIQRLPDDTWLPNGYHIACVRTICAFVQGADHGGLHAWQVKSMSKMIVAHGCNNCGSEFALVMVLRGITDKAHRRSDVLPECQHRRVWRADYELCFGAVSLQRRQCRSMTDDPTAVADKFWTTYATSFLRRLIERAMRNLGGCQIRKACGKSSRAGFSVCIVDVCRTLVPLCSH